MAMPASVALANRQMSLSLTQVNHVSWGKNKRKRRGEEGRQQVRQRLRLPSGGVRRWAGRECVSKWNYKQLVHSLSPL